MRWHVVYYVLGYRRRLLLTYGSTQTMIRFVDLYIFFSVSIWCACAHNQVRKKKQKQKNQKNGRRTLDGRGQRNQAHKEIIFFHLNDFIFVFFPLDRLLSFCTMFCLFLFDGYFRLYKNGDSLLVLVCCYRCKRNARIKMQTRILPFWYSFVWDFCMRPLSFLSDFLFNFLLQTQKNSPLVKTSIFFSCFIIFRNQPFVWLHFYFTLRLISFAQFDCILLHAFVQHWKTLRWLWTFFLQLHTMLASQFNDCTETKLLGNWMFDNTLLNLLLGFRWINKNKYI